MKSRKISRKKSIKKPRIIYNNKSKKKSKKYKDFLIKYKKILGGTTNRTMGVETTTMCNDILNIVHDLPKNKVFSALSKYLTHVVTEELPGSRSVIKALDEYVPGDPLSILKSMACFPQALLTEMTPDSAVELVSDLQNIYNSKPQKFQRPLSNGEKERQTRTDKLRCRNACLKACE